MNKLIDNIISILFNTTVKRIVNIGQGCYGVAYKVTLASEPYTVCVKTYLYPNMAISQAKDYITLSTNTSLPTLKILSNDCIHYGYNVLVTNFIDGNNLAYTDVLRCNTSNLGKDIANMLHLLHSTTNSFYGDLDGVRYATWTEYYVSQLDKMLANISSKNNRKNINAHSLEVLNRARQNINLFHLEPSKPSLLHGDFNTSNIIATADCKSVLAIIDPMNMCWGDSESDLTQLDICNGGSLRILEHYSVLQPLSYNFGEKLALYRAFGEYNHYATVNIKEDAHLIHAIEALESVLASKNI